MEKRISDLESQVNQQTIINDQQKIVIVQQTLQIETLQTEVADIKNLVLAGKIPSQGCVRDWITTVESDIEEQKVTTTNQDSSINVLQATTNNLQSAVAKLENGADQADYFFNYKLKEPYV